MIAFQTSSFRGKSCKFVGNFLSSSDFTNKVKNCAQKMISGGDATTQLAENLEWRNHGGWRILVGKSNTQKSEPVHWPLSKITQFVTVNIPAPWFAYGIGKSMTIPRDKVKPIQGTTHLGLWASSQWRTWLVKPAKIHPPIPEKKYNLLPEIGSTWTWIKKTFTLVNMRTIAGTEWSMLDVDLPHFKTSWDLISILNRLGWFPNILISILISIWDSKQSDVGSAYLGTTPRRTTGDDFPLGSAKLGVWKIFDFRWVSPLYPIYICIYNMYIAYIIFI